MFLFWKDLKDERHRATVRWTVVTASDQAAAAARVKSFLRNQKCKPSVRVACVFLFWKDLKDERCRATVR